MAEPQDSKQAAHEFLDIDDERVQQAIPDEGLLSPAEAKFFDTEEEEVAAAVSSPVSEDHVSAMVSSAIAEIASSQSEGSSDEFERPISPELALSPNPGSPVSHNAAERNAIVRMHLRSSGLLVPEFKSALATPVPEAATPITPNTETREAQPRRGTVLVKSRLVEVSDLRRKVVCQQLFGVWRTSVARDKSESLRAKLSEIGKASELVLEENARLKARLSELEAAITIMNAAGASRHTVSTGTDDLDIDLTGGTQSRSAASAYATPVTMSPSYAEFATPYSSSAAAPFRAVVPATPPGEVRRSWQEFLRPSRPPPFVDGGEAPAVPKTPLKERQPFIEQNVAPRIDKEKLKLISQDIERLTQSISLGRKTN